MKSLPKAALLVFITLIAYGSAYRNGFIWDDDHYVYRNNTLRSAEGFRQIWLEPKATPQYYPMVHSSFWLEYRFWKLNPVGYHIVNVLLHALSAVALWFLLRKLQVPGAWVAAAVFAVHPVHVESVAWITERKNVLSGLFFFLSALAYMRSVGWSRDQLKSPLRTWFIISFFFFVAALLSKTVTCSLPAVLVLLIWWRYPKLKENILAIVWLIPYFIVGFLLAMNTVAMEKEQVGAKGVEWSYSFMERCLIAGRCLWFYMGKLVYPQPLIFFYKRWTIDDNMWWQYLYPLAFAALLLVLWLLRRRIGRGPLVAMLIFAGVLLPALGFFNVYPHRYSFVADHFQYLASVAFTTLVVAVFTVQSKRVGQAAGSTFAAAAVVALGALTIVQCYSYKDRQTLWIDTIRKNPACWAAHNNLGLVLLEKEDHENAAKCFLNTLKLKPNHVKARLNLGIAFSRLSAFDQAHAQFAEVRIADPSMVQVELHAGNAYAMAKDFRRALSSYGRYLRHYPDDAQAHLNVGHVYMQMGSYKNAAMFYQNAIERDLPEAKQHLQKARAQIK